MLERHPKPIQRFKKNMARVVYNARSSVFTKKGNKNIKSIFKQFDPKWHNAIADGYPVWLKDWLADEDCYLSWRELTEELPTEDAKKWTLFDVNDIAEYLQDYHNMEWHKNYTNPQS